MSGAWSLDRTDFLWQKILDFIRKENKKVLDKSVLFVIILAVP